MKYFSASVLGIAASAILTTSVSAASGSALEHPNAYSATQTAQTPIDFSSNATGDVLFSADSLTHHKELGVIVASGNVEASYNGEVLMADQISYDQKNDSITAKGNITFLQKNGDVIFADFLEVSTDFARGAGKNIRLILSDDSRAAAAELVRTGNRDTVLKKVVYSPCKPCEEDPTRPLVWQLKAEEVRHDQKQQRFEYKDASLEFFGVPVFYTPISPIPNPTKNVKPAFWPRVTATRATSASSFPLLFTTTSPPKQTRPLPRLTTPKKISFLWRANIGAIRQTVPTN